MSVFLKFLLVFLGGGVGSVARYAVNGLVWPWTGTGLPWGTLAVNTTGSFLLALILALSLGNGPIGPGWRLWMGTGVMGGFTTYSTFNQETLGCFERGHWRLGLANLALTLACCLLAGMAGAVLGRVLAAR